VIEPYLIQLGMVARTARGRCLNDRGWQHLGLTPPSGNGGAACSTQARCRVTGDSVPLWDGRRLKAQEYGQIPIQDTCRAPSRLFLVP
jgi:hypothetical protein